MVFPISKTAVTFFLLISIIESLRFRIYFNSQLFETKLLSFNPVDFPRESFYFLSRSFFQSLDFFFCHSFLSSRSQLDEIPDQARLPAGRKTRLTNTYLLSCFLFPYSIGYSLYSSFQTLKLILITSRYYFICAIAAIKSLEVTLLDSCSFSIF